ncbi:hypothetical protein [Paenibacillus caseinilyticus]|uniref:hypothetical protein n=1 Tax=Paenibacillus caseinilyticus TaxID=3098138 RepID=UPI0022B86CDA|nr:hypothetical protein [Paenibacillus caseinilyticus]MCZ8518856.1 hypothetical protein [Paenibacillus caseinilyticus]
MNSYNAKQKTALERKKDVYIPIETELKKVLKENEKISFWNSLNKKFEFPVVNDLLEQSYIFLPKKLKNDLLEIKELVDELKTINHYSIAENIILNNFETALKDCYGDEVFLTHVDPEAGFIYENFPEPYLILRHDMGTRKNIDLLAENDHESIDFYESLLGNYKEPLKIELPDDNTERTLDVGEYIAYFYPVSNKIREHEKIKQKRDIYLEIIGKIKNALKQLEVIFTYINKNYERDKY